MIPNMTPRHERQYGFDFGWMVVELNPCKSCGRLMAARPSATSYAFNLFPHHIDNNFDAQLKRAGWVPKSHSKVDDAFICEECEAEGKASFVCILCRERRNSDQLQERFGDPPEFLCKVCYSTVSAEQWDKKVDELNEEHRYDFE